MNNTGIAQVKFLYPATKKVKQTDTYHGIKVSDPYRWLEDENSDDTKKWIENQNQITFDYLKQIPYRENIKKRLTKLWNYPKRRTPFTGGNFLFFFMNDGMQNQDILYKQEGLDGNPEVFLDPNTLSEDGTVAITLVEPSFDGNFMAVGIARAGSDWSEIHIYDIHTGERMDETINWVKFSGISWLRNGFYYSRYDKPKEGSELSGKNEYHKVYYHQIGSYQEKDKLIYLNKETPLRNYNIQTSQDEKFLFLYETESTSGNSLYFSNAMDSDFSDGSDDVKSFKQITSGFDFEYQVIDNIENRLLVMTNDKAPNKKLVLIDPEDPAPEKWQTIIEERENEVLESAMIAENKIICTYLKDAGNRAYIFELTGEMIYKIELPGIGTIESFTGKREQPFAFYSFTSFNHPTTIYKLEILSGLSEIYYESEIRHMSGNLVVNQIFYKSKDGTKIPMFIVHRNDIKLDGNNPCLLYGYGGFNISMTPSFSISRLLFLEAGGVYALPNIRGGGEYGENWHKAGTKCNKQNVFDDFIAAAEYLVKNKYTSSKKLAIAGGSNGGLLVGACMTQRPELFKVALPAVGVMDMLRFHKFTIGWAWVSDYGSSDNKDEFKCLYKYSPLHNIKNGVSYPATLVTTADHDDRVVPAHSYKFISTLQANQAGKNPVIIRIETQAGHGAGKPTSKLIEEATDIWSFVFYNLGIKYNFNEKGEKPASNDNLNIKEGNKKRGNREIKPLKQATPDEKK